MIEALFEILSHIIATTITIISSGMFYLAGIVRRFLSRPNQPRPAHDSGEGLSSDSSSVESDLETSSDELERIEQQIEEIHMLPSEEAINVRENVNQQVNKILSHPPVEPKPPEIKRHLDEILDNQQISPTSVSQEGPQEGSQEGSYDSSESGPHGFRLLSPINEGGETSRSVTTSTGEESLAGADSEGSSDAPSESSSKQPPPRIPPQPSPRDDSGAPSRDVTQFQPRSSPTDSDASSGASSSPPSSPLGIPAQPLEPSPLEATQAQPPSSPQPKSIPPKENLEKRSHDGESPVEGEKGSKEQKKSSPDERSEKEPPSQSQPQPPSQPSPQQPSQQSSQQPSQSQSPSPSQSPSSSRSQSPVESESGAETESGSESGSEPQSEPKPTGAKPAEARSPVLKLLPKFLRPGPAKQDSAESRQPQEGAREESSRGGTTDSVSPDSRTTPPADAEKTPEKSDKDKTKETEETQPGQDKSGKTLAGKFLNLFSSKPTEEKSDETSRPSATEQDSSRSASGAGNGETPTSSMGDQPEIGTSVTSSKPPGENQGGEPTEGDSVQERHQVIVPQTIEQPANLPVENVAEDGGQSRPDESRPVESPQRSQSLEASASSSQASERGQSSDQTSSEESSTVNTGQSSDSSSPDESSSQTLSQNGSSSESDGSMPGITRMTTDAKITVTIDSRSSHQVPTSDGRLYSLISIEIRPSLDDIVTRTFSKSMGYEESESEDSYSSRSPGSSGPSNRPDSTPSDSTRQPTPIGSSTPNSDSIGGATLSEQEQGHVASELEEEISDIPEADAEDQPGEEQPGRSLEPTGTLTTDPGTSLSVQRSPSLLESKSSSKTNVKFKKLGLQGSPKSGERYPSELEAVVTPRQSLRPLVGEDGEAPAREGRISDGRDILQRMFNGSPSSARREERESGRPSERVDTGEQRAEGDQERPSDLMTEDETGQHEATQGGTGRAEQGEQSSRRLLVPEDMEPQLPSPLFGEEDGGGRDQEGFRETAAKRAEDQFFQDVVTNSPTFNREHSPLPSETSAAYSTATSALEETLRWEQDAGPSASPEARSDGTQAQPADVVEAQAASSPPKTDSQSPKPGPSTAPDDGPGEHKEPDKSGSSGFLVQTGDRSAESEYFTGTSDQSESPGERSSQVQSPGKESPQDQSPPRPERSGEPLPELHIPKHLHEEFAARVPKDFSLIRDSAIYLPTVQPRKESAPQPGPSGLSFARAPRPKAPIPGTSTRPSQLTLRLGTKKKQTTETETETTPEVSATPRTLPSTSTTTQPTQREQAPQGVPSDQAPQGVPSDQASRGVPSDQVSRGIQTGQVSGGVSSDQAGQGARDESENSERRGEVARRIFAERGRQRDMSTITEEDEPMSISFQEEPMDTSSFPEEIQSQSIQPQVSGEPATVSSIRPFATSTPMLAGRIPPQPRPEPSTPSRQEASTTGAFQHPVSPISMDPLHYDPNISELRPIRPRTPVKSIMRDPKRPRGFPSSARRVSWDDQAKTEQHSEEDSEDSRTLFTFREPIPQPRPPGQEEASPSSADQPSAGLSSEPSKKSSRPIPIPIPSITIESPERPTPSLSETSSPEAGLAFMEDLRARTASRPPSPPRAPPIAPSSSSQEAEEERRKADEVNNMLQLTLEQRMKLHTPSGRISVPPPPIKVPERYRSLAYREPSQKKSSRGPSRREPWREYGRRETAMENLRRYFAERDAEEAARRKEEESLPSPTGPPEPSEAQSSSQPVPKSPPSPKPGPSREPAPDQVSGRVSPSKSPPRRRSSGGVQRSPSPDQEASVRTGMPDDGPSMPSDQEGSSTSEFSGEESGPSRKEESRVSPRRKSRSRSPSASPQKVSPKALPVGEESSTSEDEVAGAGSPVQRTPSTPSPRRRSRTPSGTPQPTERASPQPTERASPKPTKRASPQPTGEASPQPTREASPQPGPSQKARRTSRVFPEPEEPPAPPPPRALRRSQRTRKAPERLVQEPIKSRRTKKTSKAPSKPPPAEPQPGRSKSSGRGKRTSRVFPEPEPEPEPEPQPGPSKPSRPSKRTSRVFPEPEPEPEPQPGLSKSPPRRGSTGSQKSQPGSPGGPGGSPEGPGGPGRPDDSIASRGSRRSRESGGSRGSGGPGFPDIPEAGSPQAEQGSPARSSSRVSVAGPSQPREQASPSPDQSSLSESLGALLPGGRGSKKKGKSKSKKGKGRSKIFQSRDI